MIVRLDTELHDGVRRWAEANDRSIAAQVRTVLREQIPVEYLEAKP